jgi:membrane protein
MARDVTDEQQLPPGIAADKPTEVPVKGWFQILKRAVKESGKDNVSIFAGGIAYSVFSALVPTLSAVVFIYGLAVSPQRAAQQVTNATKNLPDNVQNVIAQLVQGITSRGSGALSAGLVVSILLALFSASGAMNNIITSVNVAYDEENTRGFLKKRLIAYGLTVGGIVFFIVVLALVAGLPVVLNALNLGPAVSVITQVASIVLLAALFIGALSVLYRVAPDRDSPKFRWTSSGAIIAAVIWVVASAALGLYVRVGNFGNTFGPFAGIIVLLFWLYLTAYVILLGAEINSESELQTAKDTTKGPELPLGERRAEKADNVVPGTPAEAAQRLAGEHATTTRSRAHR